MAARTSNRYILVATGYATILVAGTAFADTVLLTHAVSSALVMLLTHVMLFAHAMLLAPAVLLVLFVLLAPVVS
jgi:hypothetical protein